MVEIDTLDYVVKIIFNQPDPRGRFRLVVFYLRKMTGLELNYEIYNKELLAIIAIFKEWRVYLKDANY